MQTAITCLIAEHPSVLGPDSQPWACYGELPPWPTENSVPSGDLHSNFGLPLRHAEKINSSKAFILTYVWKALFLVISSNCWLSMVNDFGSGRVQMYTLFEGRYPVYQAAGYCGEKIWAHYVTFYTMVEIWCWWGRGDGTRGVLILSPGGHSAWRGKGRPRCWFLLQGLVFIYKHMTSSPPR